MTEGGTGRLRGELGLRSRRVVYGELTADTLAAELPLLIEVDRAHVAMLVRQSLISPTAARELVDCLAELTEQRYEPLLGRPAPRGLYLMYEGYLVERLGPDIGGVLQTGRSRNDLKATMTSLRLRAWLLEHAMQAIRLEAVLLSRARAYRAVVMPVYTHFQAAMPGTYGHYLLGIASAVGRELDALRTAAGELAMCPLGAGAVAGTDLPIDPAYTAGLLGFTRGPDHALDAVASRDVALRLLAAGASLTITLSRLATDLQLWSTAEFGFIAFPDRLVGGSSAMPQKRNAFLLEHVKAKPGHAIGAWVAAASSTAATPFTNTIEVGTEAMAALWPGLAAATDAVLLSQVLVSGARPDAHRMAERAATGLVTATWLANQFVQRGVPFRTAHRMVGDAVRRAVEAGSDKLADFGPPGWLDGIGPDGIGPAALDPATRVDEQAYGGGPGGFAEQHARAVDGWAARRQWLAGWRRDLDVARDRLADAVGALR